MWFSIPTSPHEFLQIFLQEIAISISLHFYKLFLFCTPVAFCMLCINTCCWIHKINRVVYSLVIIVSFSVVMFPCKCKQCHSLPKLSRERSILLCRKTRQGVLSCVSLVGCMAELTTASARCVNCEFFPRSKTRGLFLRARYVDLQNFN